MLLTAGSLPQLQHADELITPDGLLKHIKELSSDAYTGRLPGTPGEEKSIAYILSQIHSIGLQPGTPDKKFIQQVPLWGIRSRGTLTVTASGQSLNLTPQDYAIWSAMPNAQTNISKASLVFAGYGVVAPEYQWDDYAGIDLHGKIAVIFNGDPPVADPNDPSKLDERKFLGKALTVYGRTGTKFETAFKHGAAGLIMISPQQANFTAAARNFGRENMYIRGPEDHKVLQAQGMLSAAKAKELFAAAGQNFDTLLAASAKPGFRAVPMNATASFQVANQVRQFESANILAKIPGSDSRLKNEYVFYSGHWDHHGQEGDQIFHGASDNAAGTAGVLELARAFASLHPAPRRTIIFFWPTAEEKGLLGAKYYVDHPLYPLHQTVADINLDYFSNWGWGRTHDFSIVGIGNSTLDDITAQAVRRQGRELTGDTAPEQGFYFRSDHYEFARVGVPSIETTPGIDYIGKPAGYGEKKRAEYIRNDYHKASDVVKPDWNLDGAVEDLQILLEVGYRVAQDDKHPAWKADAVWRPKT